MFAVKQDNTRAEASGEDAVESGPVAGVDDVGAALTDDPTELEDGLQAVARLLVEFVVAHRSLEALNEFAGSREKAELDVRCRAASR